ncbi:MAG: hypothetical protein OCD00_00280 [Colwellia sp.]
MPSLPDSENRDSSGRRKCRYHNHPKNVGASMLLLADPRHFALFTNFLS